MPHTPAIAHTNRWIQRRESVSQRDPRETEKSTQKSPFPPFFITHIRWLTYTVNSVDSFVFVFVSPCVFSSLKGRLQAHFQRTHCQLLLLPSTQSGESVSNGRRVIRRYLFRALDRFVPCVFVVVLTIRASLVSVPPSHTFRVTAILNATGHRYNVHY